MSAILLGPFPYGFPTLIADARAALEQGARALWDLDVLALRAMSATGEKSGLYLIVSPAEPDDGERQSRLVGLWLSFGPEYLRDGPMGPPDPAPPFVAPLIEALIEQVWWHSLPVASAAAHDWRLPIVLEWLPALAIRAALAPPGEPPPVERPATAEPASHGQERVALAEASSVWLDTGSVYDEPTHPPLGATPLASSSHVIIDRPGTGLPLSRSVLCVFEARLSLSARLHRASFRLIRPEAFAITEWPAWVSTAAMDGERPGRHVLGAPLALPGDRVGFPCSGWLTRALAVWPGAPAELEAVLLPDRLIQSRLRGKLNQAASMMLTALAAVLGFSFALRVLADPRPLPRPPAPTPAAQPALSPCSADHERFVEELRCQIAAMAGEAGGLRPAPRCGDRLAEAGDGAATLDAAPQGDLQASFCGLLDREREHRAGRLRSSDAPAPWGELAAAQACFNALSHPREYALSAHGQQLMIADTQSFLHDPGLAIEPLVGLMAELEGQCEVAREQSERVVEGAILATHVGSPVQGEIVGSESAPLAPDPLASIRDDAARLRGGLVKSVADRLPEEEKRCFLAGVRAGTGAGRYPALCDENSTVQDAPADAGQVESGIWSKLAGDASAEGATLDRYAKARFDIKRGLSGVEPRWACHLALTQRVADTPDPKTLLPWDRSPVVPTAYNLAGAGVKRQLDLDATLIGLDQGMDLGPCWTTVRETLRDYEPVHPLIAELGDVEWPSLEQQLCGQICASWHRLEPRPSDWYTPDADLDVCVSTEAPPAPASAPFQGQGVLDRLSLPWNTPGENSWVAPTRSEVCAFHLLAQGYLGQGEEGFVGEGVSPREWAGVTVEGGGIVGGMDGRAVVAVQGLYSQGTASAAKSRCAAVAAQCLTGLLLEVTPDATRAPYQWLAAWRARTSAVASPTSSALSRRPAREVGREHPWCAPLLTYLRQEPRTDLQTSGESTCQLGVDLVRINLADAIRDAAAVTVSEVEP